jgi:hypothetical protein
MHQGSPVLDGCTSAAGALTMPRDEISRELHMRRLIAASALSLVLAAGAAEAQSVDAAAVDAAVQAVTPQVTA